MYNKIVIMLLISFSPMFCFAEKQLSQPSKKTAVHTIQEKKQDTAEKDSIDKIIKQYINMLKSLNDEMQKEYKAIELNKFIKRKSYDHIGDLYELAKKYQQPVEKKYIEEAKETIKRCDEKIEFSERHLSELKKEKEKLKMDALKYYKGKLPDSLLKAWQDADEIQPEKKEN